MSHTHRAPLFVVFKLPVMEQQERRLGSHVYGRWGSVVPSATSASSCASAGDIKAGGPVLLMPSQRPAVAALKRRLHSTAPPFLLVRTYRNTHFSTETSPAQLCLAEKRHLSPANHDRSNLIRHSCGTPCTEVGQDEKKDRGLASIICRHDRSRKQHL